MDAFNRAMSSAEAANDMQVANQIEGLKTAHNQLANELHTACVIAIYSPMRH